MLARQGIKALLPVVGALLTVPAAYAMNWAIGRAAMEYFRSPEMPKEQLKKVYEAARDEGAKMFSKERFEAFRNSKQSQVKPADVGSDETATQRLSSAKVSAAEKIVTQDFAARLEKHPEVREAFAGLIHLDLAGEGGGQWTVDLTKAEGFISSGLTGVPKLTVRCSGDDFTGLVKGRKNAQMAVLAGDLVLEPMDLELIGTLGPLFG
jgi:hypothetical protein